VLADIARLVRIGGIIIVEVPDFNEFVVDWNDALTLVHLTNFTHGTLRALGESMGLAFVGYEAAPADPPARAHVVAIFQKPETLIPGIIPTRNNWAYVEEVRQVYGRGLSEKTEQCLLFEVPEINDLSLCFKADPQQLRPGVHENFAGRRVAYDGPCGVWRVSAT